MTAFCGACGAGCTTAFCRSCGWEASKPAPFVSPAPRSEGPTAPRTAAVSPAAARATATSAAPQAAVGDKTIDRMTTQGNRADAEELARFRAHRDQQDAKFTGWKPLTIWYAFWALLFGFAALKSLFSGQFATFFVGLIAAGLAAKYVSYLYNGGRRRVWFLIW